MDVVSQCPLVVTSLLWHQPGGETSLTVIAKASFDLLPGEARLAADQEAPNDDETHWGDDPERSLYAPSDLVPFKPRADVLLVGHAFAPRASAVRTLSARLAVLGIDKAITVVGDRAWNAEGTPGEAQPFVRMSLRYERAAGGPATDNPVGLDLDGALPNLQASAVLPRRGERLAPVGFGPIAARWPGRAGVLGGHPPFVGRAAFAARPIPDDLDAAFFNAAPLDQQVERIPASASLVLENLSAQHPRLVTRLPGAVPRAFVERPEEGLTELLLTADTLWIDTDRARCTVVWRGALLLRRATEKGLIHVLLEDPAHPLGPDLIEQRCSTLGLGLAEREGRSDHDTQPIAADRPRPRSPGGRATLPFITLPEPAAHAPDPDPTSRFVIPAADSAPQWLTPSPALTPAPSAPAPVIAPPPGSSPIAPSLLAPSPIAPSPIAPSPIAPPARVASLAESAPDGLLAASNAAAGPSVEPSLAPHAAHGTDGAARAQVEIVDLLWFDPAALPGVRAHPIWRVLLDAAAPPRAAVRYDDDEPPPEEPQASKDRREVFTVLTEAEPLTESGLDDALAEAVSPMGALTPPLAYVRGELALTFDELETLKATVAAVAPLAAGDKKLKEVLDTVHELLKTPWIEGSGSVAEGLTTRVREAFAQGSGRLLQGGYLEAHTERRLLSQRQYQRRTLLGKPWLRALLMLPGAVASIPVYLPDDLASLLPIYRRFPARLLVEVHLSQDQYEAGPIALRALALSRVAPPHKLRR